MGGLRFDSRAIQSGHSLRVAYYSPSLQRCFAVVQSSVRQEN